jgi:hypothetical protein
MGLNGVWITGNHKADRDLRKVELLEEKDVYRGYIEVLSWAVE